MSATPPAVAASARALGVVFGAAVHDAAAAGAEALDLPRMTADAFWRWCVAGAWDAPAAARLDVLRYWGECMAAEPRRPAAMPDATPAIRASTIAMLDAARAASSLAFFVAAPAADDRTFALCVRVALGGMAAAYVAQGWTEWNATTLVVERYHLSGGTVLP